MKRRPIRIARAVVLALITPFLEKNRHKTMSISRCYVPVVLSMARVIVFLFACALLNQVVKAGVAGWPEATLCISIVLALPLLNALERLSPEHTLRAWELLTQRLSTGATRTIGSVFTREPSKYDDHRDDRGREAA